MSGSRRSLTADLGCSERGRPSLAAVRGKAASSAAPSASGPSARSKSFLVQTGLSKSSVAGSPPVVSGWSLCCAMANHLLLMSPPQADRPHICAPNDVGEAVGLAVDQAVGAILGSSKRSSLTRARISKSAARLNDTPCLAKIPGHPWRDRTRAPRLHVPPISRSFKVGRWRPCGRSGWRPPLPPTPVVPSSAKGGEGLNSQRNIIVLLPRISHRLGLQAPQRPDQPPPRPMRHDHVVDIAA